MALVSLKNVKAQFLKLKAKLEIAQRQEIDLSEEDFSVNVVRNSGTGKFLS
jgi:hypothetical protein